MAADPDDELARTATAPGSSAVTSAAAATGEPLGSTLGRYRLERELGAGGMGVVHAAFDPDLERRVALKVLRAAAGSSDARQRLLREARAMARLAHPNVVTVHEVGSANGRDYVAMEIIEGHTLAEWLRAAPRTEDEIVDAFIAAGRGLAAAHAAGIVHRDFKPHNVLRHSGGRIVVTDFGLARDAQVIADPLAVTAPVASRSAATASVGTSTTPSTPLAGLTVTGSLLGTPAYMAPEQWSGGAVTPATDQFAFCVALWEALAGERPFKGATVEALRAEIERGPDALDASRIPRRLRPALLRGLAREPSRRWPSMDALLAAMAPARGTQRSALVATAGAAVVGVAVVYAIVNRGGAAATTPACRSPALALEAVWPRAAAARLDAAGQGPAARQLAADATAWQAARDQACTLPPEHREARLACLDGVLARFDAVMRAVTPLAGREAVDAGALLIDPAVCAVDTPPRLMTTTTPAFRAVIAAILEDHATPGEPTPAAVAALVADTGADPCAAAFARHLAVGIGEVADRDRHGTAATELAERCSDERVRAEIAIMAAEQALESTILGTAITSKLRLGEAAAQAVLQPDLTAALDQLRAEVARRAGNVDEALVRARAAMAGFAARGRLGAELGAGLVTVKLLRARATPDDLAQVGATLEAYRARAIAALGEDHTTVRAIDRARADWQFDRGDVAGAQAIFDRLYRAEPNRRPRRITGRVLGPDGKPVAGARVLAALRAGGGAHGLAVGQPPSMRFATTGPDGGFEIPDAVEAGIVVAQLGDLRARPVAIADTVTLQLGPTARITGKVDLAGVPRELVSIVAIDRARPELAYALGGPVGPDGSFELAGVPRAQMQLFAAVSKADRSRLGAAVTVDLRRGPADGVRLAVPTGERVLHVLVRSTVGAPVVNAAVLVMPGTVPSMSVLAMRQRGWSITEQSARQIEGENAPPAVVAAARRGDLFASITDAADGPSSACAIALPTDLADRTLDIKIAANLDKLRLECVPVPPDADVVVVEVPPFPRLD